MTLFPSMKLTMIKGTAFSYCLAQHKDLGFRMTFSWKALPHRTLGPEGIRRTCAGTGKVVRRR